MGEPLRPISEPFQRWPAVIRDGRELGSKRPDTGHAVTHARASWPAGLNRLGLLAWAPLRLDTLGDHDTPVADLIRRYCHQIHGEAGSHRLEVSHETDEIVWGLIQDQDEPEGALA